MTVRPTLVGMADPPPESSSGESVAAPGASPGEPPPGGWPQLRTGRPADRYSPPVQVPRAGPMIESAPPPPAPGSPLPYRPVASSRGPRFSGRSIVGGLGLLTVLLTVAILAVLGAKVMGSVGTSAESAPDVAADVTVGADPAAPGSDPAPAGAGTNPSTGAATSARCAAERATLETASDAYLALLGAPPSDQRALVDEGLLRESIETYSLTVVDGSAVILGVGECA